MRVCNGSVRFARSFGQNGHAATAEVRVCNWPVHFARNFGQNRHANTEAEPGNRTVFVRSRRGPRAGVCRPRLGGRRQSALESTYFQSLPSAPGRAPPEESLYRFVQFTMSVICFPLPPCPRFPLALAQELPLTASFRPDRGFPVVELPVRAVSHLFPASSPADLASRLREVSVAHAGIPAAAAPHRISPCARAGAVFVAAFPASFRPLPRGHAVEPLTLAVVLANAGTPFAALNALQDAPFRFQSRERSGPQARESERFERPRAREVFPCRTTESLRIDRSLWPSFWRTPALRSRP